MKLFTTVRAVHSTCKIWPSIRSRQPYGPITRFTIHTMASRRLRKPTHLIFDFDGTLTVKDTMAILGSLPKDPPISWEAITEAYMKDYEVYKESALQNPIRDADVYHAVLRARKMIERSSAQRVQDAGFFRGVKRDDILRAIEDALDDGRLDFRDGWLDIFALFLSDVNAINISIISVNWSQTFIRCALREAARRSNHGSKNEICGYIDSMDIHANDIDGLDRPEGSCGTVLRGDGLDVQTSADKVHHMPYVTRGSVDRSNPLVVYLGDSSTDFDALETAHIGVWICNVKEQDYNKAFKETFRPFVGFIPRPLQLEQGENDLARWSPEFYWSSDLHRVLIALTTPL